MVLHFSYFCLVHWANITDGYSFSKMKLIPLEEPQMVDVASIIDDVISALAPYTTIQLAGLRPLTTLEVGGGGRSRASVRFEKDRVKYL